MIIKRLPFDSKFQWESQQQRQELFVRVIFRTSRPPVEFSTDLKFRQTALSLSKLCRMKMLPVYKNETGGIFRTH